ncbi:RNA recognition motif domain-containing protein [Ditylenchus destructor]|nr:RNA recognition motif domain-containing protein [Ditylenchus destructor]
MATLRNALKRFVRNSSILDGTTLHLPHCCNFNTFYVSRHAHTESRNGDQAQVSGPSQNSQSGKPHKITSRGAGIPPFNSAPRNFNGPCRLFVGGLSKFTTIESMHEHFRKYGNVSNCGIKLDNTGDLRNFGYVEFEYADQANIALNDFPHIIDGKEINLEPRRKNENLIVIHRLPEEISQTTLRNFYSQFGDVWRCTIVRNKSRRYAFVGFYSEEAVTRALNSLPHCIDGNEITDVKRAGVRDRKLTLRVLDLSPQTTEESLRTFYSKFGKLTRCDIRSSGNVKDVATGKSCSTGYIAYESKEELDRALEAEPHIIDGSEVFLQYLTNDFDLWIDGVPEGLTEDSLCDFFSKYGELRDCRIFSSTPGINHATVCYTSLDEVNRALAARPHIINGKLLKTKSANRAKKATFSIFVGSLPENATEKSVFDEFSKFGNLVYWEMKNDERLSKSGPYAVVTYGTLEEALEALNNEHVIEGTVVDVRKASEVAASMKENFNSRCE